MKYIILICFFASSSSLFSQTTYFVSQNNPGGQQNGLSWADAFTDLQQALAVAQYGDAIWVAAGTYKPTETLDRSVSFVLKNGVKLYGGFTGSETALDQRDFDNNTTNLSGELGNPSASDNSYHVLRGQGLDSTTILDGFLITRGSATGSLSEEDQGGGMFLLPDFNLYNTCPVIQNCRFEFNYGKYGGAMAIVRLPNGENYVNPIIRNCDFVSNRTSFSGGGIFKTGASLPGQPFIVENCNFIKNMSTSADGGGMYISEASYGTIIKDCMFEKDSSRVFSGGGVYFSPDMVETDIYLFLNNCIFKHNFASIGAGVQFWDDKVVSSGMLNVQLRKCVFTNNLTFNDAGSAYSIVNTSDRALTLYENDCYYEQNNSGSSGISGVKGFGNGPLSISINNGTYLNNRFYNQPEYIVFPVFISRTGSVVININNCVFSKNAGAIHTASGSAGKITITNCTFSANTGSIIEKYFSTPTPGMDDAFVTNCIIWDSEDNVYKMFSDGNTSTHTLNGYQIDYNLLSLHPVTISSHPQFGPHNIAMQDPLFEDPDNGNFRLQRCSPAVNAGDNVVADTLGISFDLDGNARIFLDTIDMGAYETLEACFTGTEDLETITQWSISPNPVAPGAALQLDIPLSQYQWEIVDATGAVVAKGAGTVMAPERCGLYFLHITGGGEWRSFVVGR